MDLLDLNSNLNIVDQFELIKTEFENENIKLSEYYDSDLIDKIKKNYLDYLDSNIKGIKKFAEICSKYYDYLKQHESHINNKIFTDNNPLEIKKYIDDKINNIYDKLKPISDFDKMTTYLEKLVKYDIKYKDFIKDQFLLNIKCFKNKPHINRSIEHQNNYTYLISSELFEYMQKLHELSSNNTMYLLLNEICSDGLNGQYQSSHNGGLIVINIKFQIFDETKIRNELKTSMYQSSSSFNILSCDALYNLEYYTKSFLPDDKIVLRHLNQILELILSKIEFIEKYNLNIERLKK